MTGADRRAAPAGSVRRGVTAGAVAVLLALSIPASVSTAARTLGAAFPALGDDRVAARRRTFGSPHADAIERIAAAVPRGGAAFLVDGSGTDGPATFLAYDLTPRRSLYLGRMVEGRRRLLADGRPAGGPAWVVVAARDGVPPALVPAGTFFARVPLLPAGDGDAALPAWVDEPAEGASVRGPLTVRGWGHEPGGEPLRVVVLVDGEERPPASSERQRRPDVAAALPGIADPSRTGFALVYQKEPGDGGHHELRVHVFTPAGRHRRLPPRTFRWEP